MDTAWTNIARAMSDELDVMVFGCEQDEDDVESSRVQETRSHGQTSICDKAILVSVQACSQVYMNLTASITLKSD
jgi:hypothetical protein